jgi:hypothetical protein
MVEMPPHSTGRAHFHPVDQFQVFFGSSGSTFQRSEVGDVMVHYSDAYSTYGPFATAGSSMRFFTLRAEPTALTCYMPDSRDKLVRRGRRNEHSILDLRRRRAERSSGDTSIEEIFGATDDEMTALLVAMGPGSRLLAPSSSGSGGQYYCVLAGGVVDDARIRGPQSLGWSSSETEPVALEASDSGCELLILRFGKQESQPGDRLSSPSSDNSLGANSWR